LHDQRIMYIFTFKVHFQHQEKWKSSEQNIKNINLERPNINLSNTNSGSLHLGSMARQAQYPAHFALGSLIQVCR